MEYWTVRLGTTRVIHWVERSDGSLGMSERQWATYLVALVAASMVAQTAGYLGGFAEILKAGCWVARQVVHLVVLLVDGMGELTVGSWESWLANEKVW